MDEFDSKKDILRQVEERNKLYNKFSDLISSHGKLYEKTRDLQLQNSHLKDEIEKLRKENHELASKPHTSGPVERSEHSAALEQKIYKMQEELTEVHRTKGARAQQIIDLNVALQEKEREIASIVAKLNEKEVETTKLKATVTELKRKTSDLAEANITLRDEYSALHLACEASEDKLRQCQIENRDLIERWMRYKDTQAKALNSENDKIQRVIATKTVEDGATKASNDKKNESNTSISSMTASSLASSPPPVTGSSFKEKLSTFFGVKSRPPEEEHHSTTYSNVHCSGIVRLPQDVVCRWKAHESEVTSTRFSFSGGLLATGGSDKFIHIWNFFGDKSRLQCTFRGCNGGVTAIDFDPQEHYISASSTDYACRIWAINTQRMKLTLTGHRGKVLSNKFLYSGSRLASGSSDRTVKVWDITSGACTRTFMAGSSCNDIVAADAAECLASGHFDKKIRLWDARASSQAQNEIAVGGRVTSLDMPVDKTMLVCCTKDHTLELVDLRKAAVLNVLSHDSFKVATDQTRCAFSTDGAYVCVGSSDGTVLSWHAKKGEIASVIKEHQDPVITCNWSGGRLVTGDKNKTCILWSES